MNGSVAYILCSTRSGSTWLALMLGSNSHARYAGELNRMFRDEPEGCALCTERGQWCPVFHDIATCKPSNAHGELFARTGVDVLVDNSKSLSWAHRTLNEARSDKYIHLVRDPRAVVYAWQRRGRTKGLEQWIDENYEIRDFLQQNGLDHRVVTYNDLAEHTDDVLRKTCKWLGLEYQAEQELYWEFEHHGAGRNGATASFLTDYVASDEAFYAEHLRSNFHDTRWVTELDQATRESITNDLRLRRFLEDFGFTLAEEGLERRAESAG
jgi:hypothetical protein